MATKSSSSHQGAKNTRRLVTVQDVNKYTVHKYYTNNDKCRLFVSFKSGLRIALYYSDKLQIMIKDSFILF